MTVPSFEDKRVLRSRLLHQRSLITSEEVAKRSQSVWKNFFKLKELETIGSVALYASVKNEVSTDGYLGELLRLGKRVFYPRVGKEELTFGQVNSLDELEVSADLRIPEPKETLLDSVSKIECVVVPGVAFDHGGYRLGFGKGYYDKTLKKYEGMIVGLAYDFQVLELLPREPHDRRCDFIVSESQTYHFI